MALRNAFGALALESTLSAIRTWVEARTGAKTTANSVSVNIASDQTVPISAVSLPLPLGAATSANQTTANSSLTSIDGKLPALSSGRIPVDVGTAINVGEVEVKNDTGNPVPVSAASLPLPTGAATSSNQTTANTSLANLDTDLGAQTDAAATTDTGTFSTIALIKRGLQNWTTLLGRIPALVSGRIPVDGSGVTQPISDAFGSLTVDGKAYAVTLDITRPANVTAYTAGDLIGTGSGDAAILTLSNIGPSGGFVVIQSIELVLGISVVPSGMTSFRLHFYSTKPATAAADNSVFDVTSTDRGAYVGYIDLPAPIDLGSTCFTQLDYPGKLFKLAAASTSLFCELQTIGGFTPAANSEVYSLRVRTLEAGL